MPSTLALLAMESAPAPHYAIHYYILKDCGIVHVGEEDDDIGGERGRKGKEEYRKTRENT